MNKGTHWYQIGVIVLAVVCLWLSLKPQPAHAVVMVATCPQCGEMFRCENQGVMGGRETE